VLSTPALARLLERKCESAQTSSNFLSCRAHTEGYRDDDVIAVGKFALSRSECFQDGFDLVAVDVKNPDAAGRRIRLDWVDQAAVIRVDPGRVTEYIEHAMFQMDAPASGDVRPQLLAHPDGRVRMSDKGHRSGAGCDAHLRSRRAILPAST
jgi:hypothetical protein